MAVRRINVTVEPELYDEFYKYAERKGISISPFLQAKMREFIEEEKEFEEFKKAKRRVLYSTLLLMVLVIDFT